MKTKPASKTSLPTGILTASPMFIRILFTPQAIPSLALIAGYACPGTAAACRASTFPEK